MYLSSATTTAKPDRCIVKRLQTNKPISVHKTDVCAASGDPNTICQLHNKPHPLENCRTFRNKFLDNREGKCCSSVSLFSKECKSSVECFECGSTSHDAAMHPGPSPQVVKAHSPSQEDGGEGEDYSNMAVVKTSCTEVCGPGQLILMLKNLPHKTVPKGFQGHGHQSLRNSRRLEQLLISQS